MVLFSKKDKYICISLNKVLGFFDKCSFFEVFDEFFVKCFFCKYMIY